MLMELLLSIFPQKCELRGIEGHLSVSIVEMIPESYALGSTRDRIRNFELSCALDARLDGLSVPTNLVYPIAWTVFGLVCISYILGIQINLLLSALCEQIFTRASSFNLFSRLIQDTTSCRPMRE